MEVGDNEVLCLGCLATGYEQMKGKLALVTRVCQAAKRERDALKENKALLLRSLGATSDAHTLLPRELVTDLREVVSYGLADELADYLFNNMDEDSPRDTTTITDHARKSEHILGSMVRLNDWLENLAEGPAS